MTRSCECGIVWLTANDALKCRVCNEREENLKKARKSPPASDDLADAVDMILMDLKKMRCDTWPNFVRLSKAVKAYRKESKS